MKLKEILYSKAGRILISILLGLGLSTIFRKACKNRSCLVFKAAPLDKIKGQIFKYNNKCYEFEQTAETCKPYKKKINYA